MSTRKRKPKQKKVNQKKKPVATKSKGKKVLTRGKRSVAPRKKNTTTIKQPIIAPDGKIFYPCQYCSKLFPEAKARSTHMKSCTNKEHILTIAPDGKNNEAENNSDSERSEISENQNATQEEMQAEENESDDSTPNSNDEEGTKGSTNKKGSAKINIWQNITVNKAKQIDNPDHIVAAIHEADSENTRICKHCKKIFDNPLECLRHTRDCHNFPRPLLPPEEVEQYYDYPDRSFCPICQKPIKTKNFRSIFIKHLQVHISGVMHECGICKKAFRRRDHMKAHEKRHIV